jgi:hypothetical protein
VPLIGLSAQCERFIRGGPHMVSDHKPTVAGKLAALAGGTGVALAGLATGSAAYAEVHFYDNSGLDFSWQLLANLDVTLGPLEQASADTFSSLYQYMYDATAGGTREADLYLVGAIPEARCLSTGGNLAILAAGEMVSADQFTCNFPWVRGAAYLGATGAGTWEVYAGHDLPDYLGLRFLDPDERTHYGWMQVQWNGAQERFDALAWAYEDRPDAPLAAGVMQMRQPGPIPEPGTLATFAAGVTALALARRRRRDLAQAA